MATQTKIVYVDTVSNKHKELSAGANGLVAGVWLYIETK